jgi:DNA-binding CsgD family transcriptional regulator
MLEAVQTLEETWPEGALYAQALRHRLLMRHWPDDPDVQRNTVSWLVQSGIEIDERAVIDRVDPASTTYFESHLNAAHALARLAIEKPVGKERPSVYPEEGVHAYLKRQQDFAVTHGFVGWVVEIAIARILLYQATGKKHEALETLKGAIKAAAPTGLFRIFLDECEPLQTLLEELKPRLADEALVAYASHLLSAMRCGPAKHAARARHPERLSERELEVLRYLARGLSYEEIGRQLFLSLNTVQFHVKNIYGKLLVNKRVQAIERAREMHLI